MMHIRHFHNDDERPNGGGCCGDPSGGSRPEIGKTGVNDINQSNQRVEP
jgi:hypothetical protein